MKIRKVFSDWKRYNANSKNSNTGDCVCRSISIALGLDYNEVRRQLNRYKRDVNSQSYKQSWVFKSYLSDNFNLTFKNLRDHTTVDDFCSLHKNGTYLLLTGDDENSVNGISTHLCTIIDGDLYDSWDSSDYVVNEYALVTSEATQFTGVTVVDVIEDVVKFVVEYIQKLQEKFEWGTIGLDKWYFERGKNNISKGFVDADTFEFYVTITFPEIPERLSHKYRPGTTSIKCIVKTNPKYDVKQNTDENIKKLKTTIYQFVYKWNKEFTDSDRKNSDKYINPKFVGNHSLLKNIPENIRPYVLEARRKNGRYHVVIDVEDVDPSGSWVGYYGYSIDNILERFNWDYPDFGNEV